MNATQSTLTPLQPAESAQRRQALRLSIENIVSQISAKKAILLGRKKWITFADHVKAKVTEFLATVDFLDEFERTTWQKEVVTRYATVEGHLRYILEMPVNLFNPFTSDQAESMREDLDYIIDVATLELEEHIVEPDLVDDIIRWFEDENSPRTCWITGPPGVGKTWVIDRVIKRILHSDHALFILEPNFTLRDLRKSLKDGPESANRLALVPLDLGEFASYRDREINETLHDDRQFNNLFGTWPRVKFLAASRYDGLIQVHDSRPIRQYQMKFTSDELTTAYIRRYVGIRLRKDLQPSDAGYSCSSFRDIKKLVDKAPTATTRDIVKSNDSKTLRVLSAVLCKFLI
ncbi:hypothetical protein C8J56DRAFT_1064834 [Mycena floridula]|nr:hypothetical protein C8J56DRAFT_1064834 [Mycena floridula]